MWSDYWSLVSLRPVNPGIWIKTFVEARLWSSAAHYSSDNQGPLSVGPLRGSSRVQVLHQVSVLQPLGGVASRFPVVVPPGGGSPHLPAHHLGLLRQVRDHPFPPLLHQTAALSAGCVAAAVEACLLTGDFTGIVSFGSCSPGRSLQPLGLLRQLRHGNVLLFVPRKDGRWEKIKIGLD